MAVHTYSDSYLAAIGSKGLSKVAKDKGTDQATRDKAQALLDKKNGGGAASSAVKPTSGMGTAMGGGSSGSGASSGGFSGAGGTIQYSYLEGLSDAELEARAKQNSADWHTDVAQRGLYEGENQAIYGLLDSRRGTKSTFDSATGKWTVSGGAGMSPSDILALGQGPLSGGAAANYVATGSTKPGTAYNVLHNTPQQGYTQEQMDKAIASALEQQRQKSQYDLTEYLKKQKAAQVESALAGLKGAYEQSMAGYESAGDRLQESYDAARNTAAAQDAIARRTFQEQAAASGLGSGTAGQAELARSSALTGELARIGNAQAGAEAELELQKRNLQSQYEAAIVQARQNGDSQLASALYQELVRVQGLEREDEQLAYNRDQAAEQLAYNRDQTARKEAQDRVGAYLAAMGSVDGLDAALVEQSGYTQGELSALANYYAKQLGDQSAKKPILTVSEMEKAIKEGRLEPNVLSAYEYYYGRPYSGAGGGYTAISGGGGTGLTQTAEAPKVSAPTEDPLTGTPVQVDTISGAAPTVDPSAGTPVQIDTVSGASWSPASLRPYAKNLLKNILNDESCRRNASGLIHNALRMQNISNDEAGYILSLLGY